MPTINKQWGGLNTRSNGINRPENDASDMQNVELTKSGDLVKISGFQIVDTGINANNLHSYYAGDHLVATGSDGVTKYNGTTEVETNPSNLTWDDTYKASSVEINQNLYFANGSNELLKYDGLAWYRSGAPASNIGAIVSVTDVVGPVLTSKTYRFAVQFVTVDKHGITTYGDIDLINNAPHSGYEITTTYGEVELEFVQPFVSYNDAGGAYKWAASTSYDNIISSATQTVVIAPDNKIYFCTLSHTSSSSFSDDLALGYWTPLLNSTYGWNNKTAIVNGNQTGVNTIVVDSGHDIEVGDKIYINPTNGYKQRIVVATRSGYEIPEWNYWRNVTNISPTSITFDGDPSDFIDNDPITAGLLGYVYAKNVTDGEDWKLVSIVPLDGKLVVGTNQTISFRDSTGTFNFGDLLDSEIIRENAPVGRYLTTIQNNIVVAGVESSPNTVYWSIPDESGETFNAGSYGVTVGDDQTGVITGIRGYDDYLLIGCERAIYMASGEFGTNNIKVWRVEGSEAGVDSHLAMDNIEGQCFYLSEKGVYAVGFGSKRPEELGAKINNLITDDSTIDLQNCVSLNRRIKQQYWLYVKASADPYILVYDYFYGIWLKHFHAEMIVEGMCEVGNTLYFIDSTGNLFEENPGDYKVNLTALNAYYASDWVHFGEPGHDKKFINWRGFVLGDEAYTLTLRTQKNFVETDKTNYNISINGATNFDYRHKLTEIKGQAMRFIMQSTSNEAMRITHWQVEYEATEEKMKK